MMVVAAEEIPLPAQPDPRNRRPVAFRFARPGRPRHTFAPWNCTSPASRRPTPTACARSTTSASTIPTGMFGLLGPNGAGKSTLMRTLATLQDADRRHASTPRRHRRAARQGRRAPRARLPAAGLRRLSARSAPRTCSTTSRVLKGLVDRGERRRDGRGAAAARPTCTTCARRRSAASPAACASASASPRRCSATRKLIIVDEPTAGLDPEERDALPQPAGRDRRGRDRPALDPHRLRRQRPVPAAWRSSNKGRVLARAARRSS